MTKQQVKRKLKSINIVDKLFMVSLFLQRVGNRQIAKSGLNQPQFAVLGEIAKNKDLSQKDILGKFLLEKSNLSKIIKKLEHMDLIKISFSKQDRRKSSLNATQKGKDFYYDNMAELNNLKEIFTESLTDDELLQIDTAINRLHELIVNQTKTNITRSDK